MVELSKKLSKGIPFVRVDFYEGPQGPIFGELTLYPASGFSRFEPAEGDKYFGDLLRLPS